jgi:hypothetical protein
MELGGDVLPVQDVLTEHDVLPVQDVLPEHDVLPVYERKIKR